MKIGGATLASYQYLGAGQVVGTALGTSGSDTVNRLHGGSSASYSTYMDRFGRVFKDEWFKDLGTDVPLHSVGLTYDRDSNITSVDDTLVAGYDVKYAMDNLNRLIDADEGTLSSGTIGSRTRREKWDGGGLSPTGNWLRRKLDLNGDGDWSDTSEVDDTGTFNKANEWLTRDLDSTSGTSGNNHTLTHDAAGNMTDDGKDYEYEYDVWGRLRKVRNQATTLVAEYFYDGLGQRTAWHADWDADGTVETSNDDPWYMFVYDDRWRVVATYRVASSATATSGTIDTYPKEQFIHHNAGADGRGGSSYIDSVILRDRDFSTTWTAAADSTVEERFWYGQNWRADTAVVMNSYGRPLERAKYSAYGVAIQSTSLDFNGDGVMDPDDPADFIGTPYDWDLDGDVDLADSTGFYTDEVAYSAVLPSRGQLSLPSIANRKGYAGYEFDQMGERYHVRHRVYIPDMGKWTRRDPVGYVDGMDLYEYCRDQPIRRRDPSGQACNTCSSSGISGQMGIRSTETSADGSQDILPVDISPDDDGEDVAMMYCRGLRSDSDKPYPNFDPIVRHCYVVCCHTIINNVGSRTRVCNAYSLLNERGRACIQHDSPDDPRPADGPFIPNWTPPDTVAPSTLHKTVRQKGICACMGAAYNANRGCNYEYLATDCNSNWFAGSMWSCCTGARGIGPIGAHFYQSWDCCRAGINFYCPKGSKGHGNSYRGGLNCIFSF